MQGVTMYWQLIVRETHEIFPGREIYRPQTKTEPFPYPRPKTPVRTWTTARSCRLKKVKNEICTHEGATRAEAAEAGRGGGWKKVKRPAWKVKLKTKEIVLPIVIFIILVGHVMRPLARSLCVRGERTAPRPGVEARARISLSLVLRVAGWIPTSHASWQHCFSSIWIHGNNRFWTRQLGSRDFNAFKWKKGGVVDLHESWKKAHTVPHAE